MIEDKIRAFFVEKGHTGELAADMDLFKGGFINSLFALEMVVYLEDTFKIKVKDREITEQNFRTIADIADLVRRMGGK